MKRVKEYFNKEIKDIKSFGSEIALIAFEDKKIIIKTNKYKDIEAKMLNYLNEFLPVAKVIAINSEFLAIEYIDSNSNIDELEVAKVLTSLHKNSADKFGLEFDTTIGPYRQINTQTDSWIEFFRDNRLLYMANECCLEGKLSKEMMIKIEKLAKKLDSYLFEPTPVLLHGDIWSGNVLSQNREIFFIDPAIYYGHNEIELAFIRMFHTFGDKFFKSYSEILPIEDGFFEVRSDIYNTYPLLVHIRSFGGSYLNSLERVLDRFI